ncbi:hypothetical protein N201_01515 [Helicobacter pylori UM066]|nr:hypothetical protein N201_01515 [Helicobacter pylori UM066]
MSFDFFIKVLLILNFSIEIKKNVIYKKSKNKELYLIKKKENKK